jgi:pSer/pThr/pTyr-binding forkhead associated (FHA) protein
MEDNTFQIADASVSSHHAEIVLRGSDILVKDLNSTNGTFINNEKISEAVLLPGQTLRFGQVEIKIDDGKPVTAPAGSPPAPAPVAPKKQVEGTMIIPRGVSLSDLEQGGTRAGGFDTNTAFSKKTNKVNRVFLIVGIVVGVVILGLILYLLTQAAGPKK